MEPLIRPDELARLLGVAKGTVYLWVRRGVIPYLQLQKCIRFRADEITDWLKVQHRGKGDANDPTKAVSPKGE